MAKKVLIGGGTGFIGQRLSELLVAKGYDTIKVSRKPGVGKVTWDKVDRPGKLFKDVYAVVNCAGQQIMDVSKAWTPSYKQKIEDSRVCTTRTLATAINQSKVKPKLFILISGVGAYEPSQTTRYDEYSPITGTDFFSKLTIKMENAAYAGPDVRLVIIRCGVVIGRWGGLVKNMFMSFYMGLGGHMGDGRQFLPWIHIDDLTRLILFAIENDKVKGVLNGVAPHVITNEEFTQAFAKAMGRRAVVPVPEPVLNFVLHPERAMLLLQGQNVMPKKVLNYGFEYHYTKIDDACSEVAHTTKSKKGFDSRTHGRTTE